MALDWLGSRGLYAALSSVGAIAQLGERLNGIQEVSGSIPLGSTNVIKELCRLADMQEYLTSGDGFTGGFNKARTS